MLLADFFDILPLPFFLPILVRAPPQKMAKASFGVVKYCMRKLLNESEAASTFYINVILGKIWQNIINMCSSGTLLEWLQQEGGYEFQWELFFLTNVYLFALSSCACLELVLE